MTSRPPAWDVWSVPVNIKIFTGSVSVINSIYVHLPFMDEIAPIILKMVKQA